MCVPVRLDWLLDSELLFYQCLWEAQGSSSNSPGRREHRFCVLGFLPGTQPSLPECSLSSPVVAAVICNYGQSTCFYIYFSVPSGYVLGLFIKARELRERGL